ncbi:Radial spoke head protein 4-like protein A Radial spoke head-like protein 3 [Larimichthys crocea]|uniref:Radial spoke head protein 4-like protein A Radial spoke head-like protein 3 n=1 Tax=Larimichthys crocea TaxID=215358 RepID=A0A6G0IRB4_LARCR|nr:Radial spoke head protein 4-like protein A Radial spoke head-like protein 3 [Larimichthys crocea]
MDPNRDRSEERLQSAASFKAFMLKTDTKSNVNLYDHLSRLLMKVMDERPHNVIDVFEDMSRDMKRGLFEDRQSTLRDLPQTTAAELLAEQQRMLFTRPEEADQEEELGETPLPNVSEIGFYLEQAGVGLGREEMQRVFLALKQLVESQALLRCRLWGKILGTQSSYIVAEAEYREGEEEDDQGTEDAEEEETEAETHGNENEMDPLPHSTYKPLPEVPKEALGTGANKFVYYVCKEPGLPWVKLPSVSPAQITAARQIRKFFTGNLETPIVSYPPFPGNEANYLRAQIARISAGTQVSPQGYFQAGEEEGDEEDEAPRDSYEVNPDFEGTSVTEMAESLSTWVHHVQHILQQGRCTWVNLALKPGEDSNEEGEAEEKEEEPDEPEPEVGPSLLTPLSQDAEMFNTPPWSSKISSTLTSQHAVAVLRSNLWPGAYAYACGKKFENMYIGWGLKYAGEGYSPPVPPPPQKEYPSGSEITEALDPSLEEEQALKESLEEQQAAQEEMEGTDEEEEEDDD